MKIMTTAIALLFTIFAGQALAADCELPTMPTIPDGSSSTMEEMIEGQQGVKAFQAAAAEFRACQDSTMAELKASVEEGNPGAAPKYEAATADYNESVAMEEQLAEQFNQAIRAYKAANPS